MNVRVTAVSLMLAMVLSLGTPFFVHAQTADQLRSQIAALLAQIYELRAQLQPGTTVPVTPGQTTPPTVSTGILPGTGDSTFRYSRCPNLQYNLERGMRDADVAVEVTMLQRFLAQDPQVYPEGEVTGFFGPATERAVQRFQERHGIVSYGDYTATGYGRVGPRTRHAIKNSCGAAGTHAFTVSPRTGSVPLRVAATFEFQGSSCTSYHLDWGDVSAPHSFQAVNATDCPKDTVRKQISHTYTTGGTYTVTLRIGKGSVFTIPIVGQATITTQGLTSNANLIVSTATGDAPLNVQATLRTDSPRACTSFEVDWGDGTQPIRYEPSPTACTGLGDFVQQFSHTYTTPGTYVLRAKAGRGTLASLTQITQQMTVGQGDGTATAECFVQPTSGIAPLAARARILFGGSLCDGNLTYDVDWGDGSVSEQGVCSDQNTHYEEVRHTYTTPGTYTARLQQSHPNARFSEQTCSVNVQPRGGTTNTNTGTIPSTCRSWTDGCNTCTRSYLGGPAACTQRYCFQSGTQQCYQHFPNTNTNTGGGINVTSDSLAYRIVNSNLRTVEFTALINAARACNGGVYTIYFGDGDDSLQPYPADACQLFTRTVSHSYAENGTYTALLLKDGQTIDQVTLTVSGSSSRADSNLAAVITVIGNIIKNLFK